MCLVNIRRLRTAINHIPETTPKNGNANEMSNIYQRNYLKVHFGSAYYEITAQK